MDIIPQDCLNVIVSTLAPECLSVFTSVCKLFRDTVAGMSVSAKLSTVTPTSTVVELETVNFSGEVEIIFTMTGEKMFSVRHGGESLDFFDRKIILGDWYKHPEVAGIYLGKTTQSELVMFSSLGLIPIVVANIRDACLRLLSRM